ncbi:hypothetical protein CPLU01_08236 [Colletotrichum plurivorum]|uniref:Uncharacterized protein n=1 Tax=Colletotrichum plurivorum TaxID=2175906 RepID=A0A8H6KCN8_9PEZI|nr:hypothetical protein CPLU01_08236 [Colletotrichum plurivorum]
MGAPHIMGAILASCQHVSSRRRPQQLPTDPFNGDPATGTVEDGGAKLESIRHIRATANSRNLAARTTLAVVSRATSKPLKMWTASQALLQADRTVERCFDPPLQRTSRPSTLSGRAKGLLDKARNKPS